MPTMTTAALTFNPEFAEREATETEFVCDYLDRCRKVSVGPSVCLSFENATTLAFRVHEVQKLRRVYPAAVIQRMLGFYSSLLPGSDRLVAAVSVRRPGRRPTQGLNCLGNAVAEGAVTLRIGDWEVRGEIMPGRASDRTLGPSFWISFRFDASTRAALCDFSLPATIAVDAEGYSWECEPLTKDVRQSLCDDFNRRF